MTSAAKRGFTLVETVIVIGLVAAALIVITDLFVGNHRLFALEEAQIATAGTGRDILDQFVEVATQATAVLTSVTIGGTSYTSSATTTVLSLPSITSSGDLISGQSDTIVFQASSTEFYIVTELGAGSARRGGTRKLSDTIKQVTFTYNNANFVAVNAVTLELVTETTTNGSTTVSYTTKGRASLRNH